MDNEVSTTGNWILPLFDYVAIAYIGRRTCEADRTNKILSAFCIQILAKKQTVKLDFEERRERRIERNHERSEQAEEEVYQEYQACH